ncbi:LuxR C-terminal-related transcriptional regulator [Neobacillus bataviensis]|uniref:LuxR C-terminal-related transcriptional regulator n=1 Tax=Neobacillus bataviensis TaxID=220685 RepID=UPI001CBF7EE9|nr:LuxR C-terminal-related transcriptional regulator [Neobacillus bataviensis]
MEHKVEQLLLKGLDILMEHREPFMKEWKELLPTIKFRNESLVDEFDIMIEIAIQKVLNEKKPRIDSFILSVLTEWQKRFSNKFDENETIFLVTTIENIFHKLVAATPSASFFDHQAIQAFFARILDQALLTQDSENLTDKWVKMIMATNILPMKWVAVVKKEQDDFQIDSVVCSPGHEVDSHLLSMCSGLKSGEIDHLSLAISRLIGAGTDKGRILKIPCLNEILLVCLQEQDLVIGEQQIQFIRDMYLRQLKLYHLERKIVWKDASLLFLQHLLCSRNADDAVKAITKGLVDYMPFSRCALFLYNHYEDTGIGVSGYNVSIPSVQQIKEEVFELSLIQKYLLPLIQSQPLYFEDAAEILPKKYIQEYKLRSLVILPIFVPSKSRLLGIALLDQGENSEFAVSSQTLATLIKFGRYAGELMYSIWDEAIQQFGGSDCLLTQREKEVLKLIAEGASINEAAKELHLSSYTVRDYVSVIIQKLAAKNRTDAAVKALKMNLIS